MIETHTQQIASDDIETSFEKLILASNYFSTRVWNLMNVGNA